MSLAALNEAPSGPQLLTPVLAAGCQGVVPTASQVAQIGRRAAQIRECPPTELYDLLTASLCGRHPDLALQALHDLGLLAELLPELDATVDFSQEAGRRHKDVWAHTKIVVWQSVPSPTVRWAAALHDIGKVPTRRFLPGGRVTFHGHAELGERMFERGPLRRIAFPPAVGQRVAELIRWHLRPGQYDGSWTDAAVRRFAREVGPALDDLLNLSRADITSKRPGKRKRCLRQISELAQRIRALAAEDRKPKPLPAGLGANLMAALELPPGPHIGVLRRRLEQLCEAGELEGGREPDYYIEQIQTRELLADVEIEAAPKRRRR
ncbi:multifunctional tRNA nucleotidyl transferase/2'3'-cyclic phosphodiesterase/2'nucleotidase/phosphatase [Enhygromyxa salina]|uniref:Multifunctional tRNA nucleotidyl transferase/2'3'-cyclic phosphodiesterase/2'nucleotidase/phosphatase n=1 Tax=Enhygromyxa salina TaxID=215803 RepID=A0A2S9XRH4_9BACT|nr:HD domain-containing protein [Enhygromyxa salina]PRP95468.1 multifunctional tRNA nucleotidyl transferase/2'3'-cyclic phosphodiesterase/2'nucleotidase/phosphatase [Enhygromyxa salina]